MAEASRTTLPKIATTDMSSSATADVTVPRRLLLDR